MSSDHRELPPIEPRAEGSRLSCAPGDALKRLALVLPFALLAWTEEPMCLNLKCEPNQALSLRDTYPEFVTAGYHMNKRHWNTVRLDDALEGERVKSWITDSYDLIYNGLPKTVRAQLEMPMRHN